MNRRGFLIGGTIAAATGVAWLARRSMRRVPVAEGGTIVEDVGVSMALPLYTLLSTADSLALPGDIVWQGPHEKAEGAYERRFRIPEGHVILTTWQGHLHCVIYQTPLENEASIASRNARLFKHYGEGHDWNEVLDNGFGKIYRRADMQRFALWGYAMDFNTFGTMEFHEVMWG